jgi:hypothetical protein
MSEQVKISARVLMEDVDALRRLAAMDGGTVTEALRRAIAESLALHELKAQGNVILFAPAGTWNCREIVLKRIGVES